MFRRRGEQMGGEQIEEKAYSLHTETVNAIKESGGKREEKTKEGFREKKEEKEKKHFMITLYLVGGGAPVSPNPHRSEMSEETREGIAREIAEGMGADEGKPTREGFKIVFRKELKGRKEAVMFGKARMSDIEGGGYKFSVGVDRLKGDGGVEVTTYDPIPPQDKGLIVEMAANPDEEKQRPDEIEAAA